MRHYLQDPGGRAGSLLQLLLLGRHVQQGQRRDEPHHAQAGLAGKNQGEAEYGDRGQGTKARSAIC